MTMKPGARKLALTAHVTFSVGWFGAVAAYFALSIAGLSATDGHTASAAYVSMDVIARFVVVPFALATVTAGLIESLGTPWGLLRHWWVLLKFVLTTGGTILLLNHLPAITRMSVLAANTTLSDTDFRDLRIQLVVHAAGGLLVLFGATLLSVYKPWGLTPYGLRNRRDHEASAPEPISRSERDLAGAGLRIQRPRWAYIIGFHVAGLLLLFLFAHIAGLRPMSH